MAGLILPKGLGQARTRELLAKEAQSIQWLLYGVCFGCGRDDRPVSNVPKSLAVSYRVCSECALRHDVKELREESERLMLVLRRPDWKRRMTPLLCAEHDERLICRTCKKNRVVQNPYTHEVPLVCDDCWRHIQRLRNGEVTGGARP